MDWLWRFDQEAFRAIHVGLSSRLLDPLFGLLSYSGLGIVQFLAALVLIRWRSTKAYALPVLSAILVGGIPVPVILKKIVERERPSNLSIATPFEDHRFGSYPSGHTSTAFAVAVMLLLATWGTPRAWIGRWAVAWAFGVGISRIYRGIHWPTDALGGMCWGTFAACGTFLALRALGHVIHLDQPGASLTGEGPRE